MSFKIHAPNMEPFAVYCVCSGFGFPFGTASTKRIRLMGKCLVTNGIPFHVWHIGPSSFEENKQTSGEYEGLTFEYLSPSICRPVKRFKRAGYYLWGCIMLIFRLFQSRHQSVVYVYSQGDFINFWVLLLCRMMKIPSVQEACEWWPGTADGNLINEWMYRKIMFCLSNGAMPISHEIQERISCLSSPDYPLCRVPVLVNTDENDVQIEDGWSRDILRPVLLWCGMVDGYKRDVLFLIDSLAELTSAAGRNSLLRIVGPCSDDCRTELISYARSKNVSPERLDIVGFVSDAQLRGYCSQADALLMPLWEDDRSSTRFPTKLGQYLAAGRPIVTAPVGEIIHFLNSETAMFYPPGDTTGFTNSLELLLTDPGLGDRLALRATLEVLPKVDISSNALRISEWFGQIYAGAGHA